MLISRVPDETGEGRGAPDTAQVADNFRTASELFDLMTKDHDFNSGDDPLTTRDLVLLYKNIDLGNQLMSNVNDFKRRAPNQYVENVIYHDVESDSELSETYSSEDLHNSMMVNKERIDLLTNNASLNSLCHKLGDLEIQVSNISTDYDKHFLFKDRYIKEQLKSLQLIATANDLDTGLLPTSLLDYVCCKRLEENYNFYMDNIIRYVENSIDQLKRISNGDYLTDRVKEKWREVEQAKARSDTSKALTTSVSIPLRVERKVAGVTTAWDDIVHSEVDLRSLVKILEKKIVLQVPKIIGGSYNLFSKYHANSLIVSCKRKKKTKEASRVGVVLQLQRAGAARLGDIDSIMILPKQRFQKDCTDVLSLTYEKEQPEALPPKIIELPEIDQNDENESDRRKIYEVRSLSSLAEYRENDDYNSMDKKSSNKVDRPGSPAAVAKMLMRGAARVVRAEAATSHLNPNDLQFSLLNLNRQTSLPEESSLDSFYKNARKKSPVRVRVKSPYENKSAILEERKRRRLLEIRARRERKKLAMNDINKVTKHKPSPQAASSVTKLSITNKAFYDSIYGRNFSDENAKRVNATIFNKNRGTKGVQKKDGASHTEPDKKILLQSAADFAEKDDMPSDRTSKSNKCHFLDDADTEMSSLQRRLDNGLRTSTSTSVVSNESATNLRARLDCHPSLTSLSVTGPKSATVLSKRRCEHEIESSKTRYTVNQVPSNTPNGGSDKTAPAVECRRSLEKIYKLMKKLRQIESNETTSKKRTIVFDKSQGSETSVSESSLDRRLSFTEPSYATLEKLTSLDDLKEINMGDKSDQLTAVMPKVVISTKPHAAINTDETKKERKKPLRIRTIPENPLKAISQLLHEFDNVQKSRQKIVDPKSINRSMTTEPRNFSRPELQKRRVRIESPVKESPSKAPAKNKTRFTPREEVKPEVARTHVLDKRKITDLIDEAKEARGEAVRGPPKFSSRLNALAQPKRLYVQALNEEFSRRQIPERNRPSRIRRRGNEDPLSLAKSPHSIERAAKPRRSPGGSPEPRCSESRQLAALAAAAAAAHSLRPTLKKSSVEPASDRCSHSAERGERARAPLLPGDLELLSRASSPEKVGMSRSTRIGNKLHLMVASVLRAERPAGPKHDTTPEPTPTPSTASVYDFLGSQISTVIEEVEPSRDRLEDARDASRKSSDASLEMLECALTRGLSCGAFPAPRLDRLALAPQRLLRRVVTHRAGDTSLVLRSGLPHQIRVPFESDHKTDLMALLSTTRLNCGPVFPLQISTVGYAFPVFRGEMNGVMPKTCKETPSDATSYTVSEKLSPASTVAEKKDGREEKSSWCVVVGEKSSEAGRVVPAGRLDSLGSSPTSTIRRDDAPKIDVETNTTDESDVFISPDTTEKCETATNNAAEGKHQLSDYSSSLDMLVELLNEIQKITTCPTDATASDTLENEANDLSSPRSPAGVSSYKSSAETSNELDGFKTDNCCPLFVSNTNENDVQSEIVSPETKSVSAETMENKPLCKDKEVLAQIFQTAKQCVDMSTDPPPCRYDLLKQASNPNISDVQSEIFTQETKSVSAETMENKPLCTDKEVFAQVGETQKQCTDVSTDPPPYRFDSSELVSNVSDVQSEIFIPETKSVSAETMRQKPLCKDEEILAQVPKTQDLYADMSTDPPPCTYAPLARKSNANVCDVQPETVIPEIKSVSAEAIKNKPSCEDEVLAHVPKTQNHYADMSPDPTPCLDDPSELVLPYNTVTLATTEITMTTTIGNDTEACPINVSTSSSAPSAVTRCEDPFNRNASIQSGEEIIEQAGMYRSSVKSLVPFYDNMSKVENAVTRQNVVQNNSTQKKTSSCDVSNIVPARKSILNVCDEVQKSREELNNWIHAADFDSTLKMKRDVLVTFYSILVLTVFAALALPEILQPA